MAPVFVLATVGDDQMLVIKSQLDQQGVLPVEHPVLHQEIGKHTLILPPIFALKQDVALLINKYAHNQFLGNCGEDWPMEIILAMLQQGPHTSAISRSVTNFLRKKNSKKVTIKYTIVHKLDDIRNITPKSFKISPIAIVPHKIKQF